MIWIMVTAIDAGILQQLSIDDIHLEMIQFYILDMGWHACALYMSFTGKHSQHFRNIA